MIFYFHFEGRDFLYCPTKTILNPPIIIFCKDMELTSLKCYTPKIKTEPMNSG